MVLDPSPAICCRDSSGAPREGITYRWAVGCWLLCVYLVARPCFRRCGRAAGISLGNRRLRSRQQLLGTCRYLCVLRSVLLPVGICHCRHPCETPLSTMTIPQTLSQPDNRMETEMTVQTILLLNFACTDFQLLFYFIFLNLQPVFPRGGCWCVQGRVMNLSAGKPVTVFAGATYGTARR